MKVDDLVQYARLEMPGILDVIIAQAIVFTAIDFCTQTRTWNEIQDPILLVDGVSEYDTEAPTDARVLTISDVWAADRELTPITLAALAHVLPNWQTAQGNQPQYYNAARDWRTITVYPIPTAALRAKLTFRAQYAPTLTAKTVPDLLAERYFDGFISGVKARLMFQVNVPWANPMAAIAHKQTYDTALAQARIDQLHERVPASVSVRPVRFG